MKHEHVSPRQIAASVLVVFLTGSLCLGFVGTGMAGEENEASSPNSSTDVPLSLDSSADLTNTLATDDEINAEVNASMVGNNITEAQARKLIDLQGAQFEFTEQVSAQYADTVGGYSLDLQTGGLSVHVTPDFQAWEQLEAIASPLGLPLSFDQTAWSINALDDAADELSASLGADNATVTPDYERSTLIVGVVDAAIANKARSSAAGIVASPTSARGQSRAGATTSVPIEVLIDDPSETPSD